MKTTSVAVERIIKLHLLKYASAFAFTFTFTLTFTMTNLTAVGFSYL